MSDSTAIKSLTEAFTHLLQESSKVGTPAGNPVGVAVASVLLVAALVVLAAVVIDKRARKDRKDFDEEQRKQREDEKRDAAERLAKAEQRAEQQRERDERLQREQRERDEATARERAQADQQDRERARTNLTNHVDQVLDDLKQSMLATIQRLDIAVGAMQGKLEAHSERIVSLETEVKHLQQELATIKATKGK